MTTSDNSQGKRDPSKEMPKWLIYGLLIKSIAVTLIVIGVLWWSGVFG